MCWPESVWIEVRAIVRYCCCVTPNPALGVTVLVTVIDELFFYLKAYVKNDTDI